MGLVISHCKHARMRGLTETGSMPCPLIDPNHTHSLTKQGQWNNSGLQ